MRSSLPSSLRRRNDGQPYTVSPHDLIWDGDYYYLTGFCDERDEVRIFRVDRIENRPDVLEEKAVAKPKGYKVDRYTKETFGSSAGKVNGAWM